MEYLKNRVKIFFEEFLSSYWIVVFFLAYIAFKIWSNLSMGASIATAFRSGLLGAFFYLMGCLAISFLSVKNERIKENSIKIPGEKSKVIIYVVMGYAAFLFAFTYDIVLKRIDGDGFLSFIPGYDIFLDFINQSIAVPLSEIFETYSRAYMFSSATGVLFYIVIPLVLFSILKLKLWKVFNLNNTRASWIFVVGYLVMFTMNSQNSDFIWMLLATLVYPALSEEFFHKAVVLRSVNSLTKKVGTAVVVSALIFALMHFPERFLITFNGNILQTLSEIMTVGLFGIFTGYGFVKTGTIIPWVIIHALSNVINIM